MIATLLHEDLSSAFGLRSLAKSSKLYQVPNSNRDGDAPLYRGDLWYRHNHLAMVALEHYSDLGCEMATHALEKVDEAIVDNVVRIHNRTGMLFERYADDSGEGRGLRHYAGATALIALDARQAYE